LPSGENIEGFQSAPLAAITDEAPYAKQSQLENSMKNELPVSIMMKNKHTYNNCCEFVDISKSRMVSLIIRKIISVTISVYCISLFPD
jgi:hypothetical protein